MGSTGVMIGGKPAARMGDFTAHGGVITLGCPTVLVGEIMPGSPASPVSPNIILAALLKMNPAAAVKAAQIIAMKVAAANGKIFCENCSE
jgi:hypothetical protein